METINDAYARYAGENHDLAISITARELGLEECCVREVIDAVDTRNIQEPRMRVARKAALRRIPDRAKNQYPTLGQ
jgi:hypothetical protein